jgi:hypothetical protein
VAHFVRDDDTQDKFNGDLLAVLDFQDAVEVQVNNAFAAFGD